MLEGRSAGRGLAGGERGAGRSAGGRSDVGARGDGDRAGLYGGSGDAQVCDAAKLVGYLNENPDKAQAFSGCVGHHARGDRRLRGVTLTPVVLLSDTLVTNHGFEDGQRHRAHVGVAGGHRGDGRSAGRAAGEVQLRQPAHAATGRAQRRLERARRCVGRLRRGVGDRGRRGRHRDRVHAVRPGHRRTLHRAGRHDADRGDPAAEHRRRLDDRAA